jgi:hypothetical protein
LEQLTKDMPQNKERQKVEQIVGAMKKMIEE